MTQEKTKKNRTNIVINDTTRKQSEFLLNRLNVDSFSALVRFLINKEYYIQNNTK